MRRAATSIVLGSLLALAGGVLLAATRTPALWYFIFGLLCALVIIRQAAPALITRQMREPLRRPVGSVATLISVTTGVRAPLAGRSKPALTTVRFFALFREGRQLHESAFHEPLATVVRMHLVQLVTFTLAIAAILIAVFVPEAHVPAVAATVILVVVFLEEEYIYLHHHAHEHDSD